MRHLDYRYAKCLGWPPKGKVVIITATEVWEHIHSIVAIVTETQTKKHT
jgi:hypothetical protein